MRREHSDFGRFGLDVKLRRIYIICHKFVQRQAVAQFDRPLIHALKRADKAHLLFRNAGEVIDALTMHMNKVRQAAITKEIIEIVSGAAAL